jgi:hypothetical protein
VVGSPTHPVMPNLVMLWKMSPLRGGVPAGGYQVVGAEPRLPEPGRNWAQTDAGGGGLVGPWVRCGGRRGGQPRLLISTYNIRVRELQQAFCSAS